MVISKYLNYLNYAHIWKKSMKDLKGLSEQYVTVEQGTG